MPTKVVWSNLAQQTLLDIYVAIGLDNPAIAERWYDSLKRRASQLSDQPRMGPAAPTSDPKFACLSNART